MAVGFPRTYILRDPGGNFRASYDLVLGTRETLLLLNSIDQKVSQKAIPDSRGRRLHHGMNTGRCGSWWWGWWEEQTAFETSYQTCYRIVGELLNLFMPQSSLL